MGGAQRVGDDDVAEDLLTREGDVQVGLEGLVLTQTPRLHGGSAACSADVRVQGVEDGVVSSSDLTALV